MQLRIVLLLLCLTFCVLVTSQAQTIVKAEYFIDTEPGFGNGIPIPISTPLLEVPMSFNADISGVSVGYHYIHIRGKDSNGEWSETSWRGFYKHDVTLPVAPPAAVLPNIIQAEIFFDVDPGFGHGVVVPVGVPGSVVSLAYPNNINALAPGYHFMHIRGKDIAGVWSQTSWIGFYKVDASLPVVPPPTALPNITQAEIFFDTDPGIGKAIAVPITVPASTVTLSASPGISTLAVGPHIINLRAKDATGEWSAATGGSFVKEAPVTTGSPFTTTWTTSDGIITVPITTGTYNYNASWTNLTHPGAGDGVATGETGELTITGLSNGDVYRLDISGTFPGIFFNQGIGASDPTSKNKIRTVEQWGNIAWSSMANAFDGCSNLTVNATDAPDLSEVSNLSAMFRGAPNFNSPIDMWDVSSATDMSGMFYGDASFNQPLNSWNVSSVTNMSNMFAGAKNFNQPLDQWNVSAVVNMSSLFLNAERFNQPINNWNVGSVKYMSNTFCSARSFNQPLDLWNVSSVTGMYSMFSDARLFDQPLNSWNVGAVRDMSLMFFGAQNFNQPLDNWNVSAVQTMASMFQQTDKFNQTINTWTVSSVADMSYMFRSAWLFNQPLNNWDVSKVTNMNSMFNDAEVFDQSVGNWKVGNVTDMRNMFTSSGLSDPNYDAILLGWDNSLPMQHNVTLDAPGNHYCASQVARNLDFISAFGWTINDAGYGCPPIVIVNQPGFTSLCAGTLAHISLTANGSHLTYQWQFAPTSTEPFSNITDGNGYSGSTTTWLSVKTEAGFGDGFYRCLISDDGGSHLISGAANLVITLIPDEPGNLDLQPFYCAPATITITATGPLGFKYYWYTVPTGGTPDLSDVTKTYLAQSLSATTDYYVSLDNGCEGPRHKITVTVSQCHAPTADSEEISQAGGSKVVIDLSKVVHDADDDLDPSSLTVVVESGAPFVLDAWVATIDYTGRVSIPTDKISIDICDLTAQCASSVITLNFESALVIYNAVSNNGDANNPVFLIDNIDAQPNTQLNKVTIFNRWGDEVYSVDDYNNNDRAFSGVGKDGSKLPTGTYFYRIHFVSGLKPRTGYISLKN